MSVPVCNVAIPVNRLEEKKRRDVLKREQMLFGQK